MSNWIFSNCFVVLSPVEIVSYVKKNALWKKDEIVSKSKIILKEMAGNRGKTWQTERSGDIYWNRETTGGTGGVEISVYFLYKLKLAHYIHFVVLASCQLKIRLKLVERSIKSWDGWPHHSKMYHPFGEKGSKG